MNNFFKKLLWVISKNRKINDLRDLPFELRYEKLSFAEFVENIASLEKQIVEDLYVFSVEYLVKCSFLPSGDIFKYKNNDYRFYLIHPAKSRELTIQLLSVMPSKIGQATLSINKVGIINKIVVHYSISIEKIATDFLELAKMFLNHAYMCLEKKFISSFKSIRELLFDNLYNTLNIEIERQGKRKLLGKAVLAVTNTENMQFRYFFDIVYLQQLLNYFKKNQDKEFSPVELAICLLSEEATHTINLLMEINVGELKYLSSSQFKSLEEDYRFWKSEAHFLEYKEISAFAIFKNNKIILQLSTKRELETEFLPIFSNVKELLKEQFLNNIKAYYKYATHLKAMPKPKITANSSKEIAEFLGHVLGKTISQIIS